MEKETLKGVGKRDKLRKRWREFIWSDDRITKLKVELRQKSGSGELIEDGLKSKAEKKLSKVKQLKGELF